MFDIIIVIILSILFTWSTLEDDTMTDARTIVTFLVYFSLFSTLQRGISAIYLEYKPVHYIDTEIKLEPFLKSGQFPNVYDYDWYVIDGSKTEYEFKVITFNENIECSMVWYANKEDCTILIDDKVEPHVTKRELIPEKGNIMRKLFPLDDIVNKNKYIIYVPNHQCVKKTKFF